MITTQQTLLESVIVSLVLKSLIDSESLATSQLKYSILPEVNLQKAVNTFRSYFQIKLLLSLVLYDPLLAILGTFLQDVAVHFLRGNCFAIKCAPVDEQAFYGA